MPATVGRGENSGAVKKHVPEVELAIQFVRESEIGAHLGIAVQAGERINGESMRDLVGVGFVHVTTSRLFVTEEGAAWLRSSGIEVSSYA